MSGGSLPWFAHLLVVLAWHIQALAGPGSGYAWAARGACRGGVRGCAQVAGQHAAAPRGASGGRPAGGGVAWAPRAREKSKSRASTREPINANTRPDTSSWTTAIDLALCW